MMKAYQDRADPRNGPNYQTGKACIENGCNEPAGTWWSKLWCFDCNVERMNRIDAQFAKVGAALGAATPDPEDG